MDVNVERVAVLESGGYDAGGRDRGEGEEVVVGG